MTLKIGKKKAIKKSSGGSLRNKFKKRSTSVLEKTYEKKSERKKTNSDGKSIFNQEMLDKLNLEVFTPHKGDNYVEILPMSHNSEIPYYDEIPVHFQVGFNSDSFICPKALNNKNCYRCEQRNRLWKTDPTGVEREKAISYYPSDRIVYFVWDRTAELAGNEEPEFNVKIWNCAKIAIHAEIQARVYNKKTREILDITDLSDAEDSDGRTVTFEKHQKGKSDYPDYKAFSLMERDDPIPDEILKQLENILEEADEQEEELACRIFYNYSNYDEIKESALSENVETKEVETTKKTDDSPDEDEVMAELEKLEEELQNMSSIKLKIWCKKNKHIEALDEDDAVEAVIEKEYERRMGI